LRTKSLSERGIEKQSERETLAVNREDGQIFEGAFHPKLDPDRGVFETLLVRAGEPIALAEHLERLARSLDDVYSLELPEQVGEEIRHGAQRLSLGRLRLTAVPSEEGLRLETLSAEIPAEIVFPAEGMRLHTHPVEGGLGPHKWVHRPGINRPSHNGTGALVVDEGEVLEAGWANVFAVRGGTLFTPPLDGRILPGTTRATLLAIAAEEAIETREHPLTPAGLHSADEVFLTGSIRGIEPAQELDDQPLAGSGPLTHHLAAALKRRWNLRDELGDPAAPAAVQIAGQPSQ
jgi:para-aminobenzoate synthetase/4-amino-4-deoxychorismate lyase